MAVGIQIDQVWMMYNLSREKEERAKEYAINLITGRLVYDRFWALKDVTFKVEKGDSLGIVGLNGSGKSTLLKIISGILKPTIGSVFTAGTIAPLIELGGGFDNNLTAKENIYFTGSMHGFSKKYLDERYPDILEFAGLKDFAQVPLRNFSSGMRSRLGFSIATNINPDILIIDEVLSVGDAPFREKSFARTRQIIDHGATVLFVSHSLDQVKQICSKVLWLQNGHVKMLGAVDEVCEAYTKYSKLKA